MRNPARGIPHNINQHGHARRKMPQNMTMEQPHPGIISTEAEHRVPATGDLDCITEGGAREIVRLEGGVFWIWGFGGGFWWFEAWWVGVCEGVVRAPAVGGFLDGEDVEVVAVLGGV